MNPVNLDHERAGRLGFPEVIYGPSKPARVLIDILHEYEATQGNALVTKLDPQRGEALLREFPGAFFDGVSGVFALRMALPESPDPDVGIIAAGTSDLFVVNESYFTLAYLGVPAERIMDVGVAGVHRLTSRLERLRRFRALIVVAGFEGALPTLVGGLLPQPIIGVPTSVGYGVGANGVAALHTMLSSCANGVVVVNIDNGYGAAMAAFRLMRAGVGEAAGSVACVASPGNREVG
jgi:NCAIR mutase (PurE)-related protein